MDRAGRGGIVETLLALEREGATGALEFRAEGVLTRIFVQRGLPAFAESGVLGETLGHVLVREQIITDRQFAAVVRKMTDAIIDDENVRFGEVTIELGILTREDLDAALATQVERKIMGCVHRDVGEWTFNPSSDVSHLTQREVPIRTLLVDAAKLLPDTRIQALLGLDHTTYPRVTQGIAKIAEDFGLESDELAALELLDGTRETKTLVATAPEMNATGSSTADVTALLAALAMGGALELLDKPAERAPPSVASPVAATGRRRAMRSKAGAREKANAAVERFIRARKAPLPAPRNEREASLFAEDEFQAGKRLFFQGKLEEAHGKLKIAVERSPDIALYKLYDNLVDSKVRGHFLDAVATKKIAIQVAKEDSECAFAYYVLGYVALGEGSAVSAKRLFRQAFKLDAELVDAGRQARLLEMRGDEKSLKPGTPFGGIVPTLLRTAKADTRPAPMSAKESEKKRTLILAGVLVVVILAAVVVVLVLKH